MHSTTAGHRNSCGFDIFGYLPGSSDYGEAIRSSYGLLGIIYEATSRTKPLEAVAFYHRTFTLEAFQAELPDLISDDETIWILRNALQKRFGPLSGRFISRCVPVRGIRDRPIDGNNKQFQILLNRLHSKASVPTDQIIRYPDEAGLGSFTVSIWTFPETSFSEILEECCRFCRSYYSEHGYRTDQPSIGYRISRDQSSLLSHSRHDNVMSIDPASTAAPGWKPFLQAFNRFCSERGGRPLFNQTPLLDVSQVERAYGEELEVFRQLRDRFDPENRFLNDHFGVLLGESGA